ncbi:MAG TPA: hypothetical protein VI612_00865 [Candidatus Nanoarchaeia archaeon]|nr:hypothetical protein [Candidatus Nanoarchaeia archaeon]
MSLEEIPEELLPQEPNPSDSAQIHLALQGFYQALSQSVCDPICIPSGIPDRRFDKIFYDMAENPQEARKTMQERIRKYGFTISAFVQNHEKMVDILASIEEAANVTSTERVKTNIAEFIRQYREHILLIDAFRVQPEKPELFLDYPNCHTTALSERHVRIVGFNPTHDYIGALKAACALEDLVRATDQQLSFGPINAAGAPYSGLAPQSGMDTSYRGRVEFVKILLQKTGFTFSASACQRNP